MNGAPDPDSPICNGAVPNDAVYDRFLHVVRALLCPAAPALSLRPGPAACTAPNSTLFQAGRAAKPGALTCVFACGAQVRYFANNGFYVLLDNQFNYDTCAPLQGICLIGCPSTCKVACTKIAVYATLHEQHTVTGPLRMH